MCKLIRILTAPIVLLLATFITSPIVLFAQSPGTETIQIDASARATPLPHFWEHFFGSGRAILSLRESYRQDLRDVKKITAMQYIRCTRSGTSRTFRHPKTMLNGMK